MKITRVSVYAVDLPGKGGGYRRTTGFSPASNSSTIVKVDTDQGISGLGEVCPLGTHYMRGFAAGAQAGIPLLAKSILGADPFHVERLNRLWDVKFKEDLYVKTAVDMALWDIMGRATDRPVSDLLGGSYDKPVPLYRTVHLFREHEDTAEMWARRCRVRQVTSRFIDLRSSASRTNSAVVLTSTSVYRRPVRVVTWDTGGP